MHLVVELADERSQVGSRHPRQLRRVPSDRAIPTGLPRRALRGHAGNRGLPTGLCATTTADHLTVCALPHKVIEDVDDLLAQRLRVDTALGVVGDLLHAPAVRLVDGPAHRRGHLVGVHVHLTGDVPGRPADGLDQRFVRPQEALLVRIQDGDQ